jgi:uncharacterized coiled-coil protein SlyX
LGTVASVFARDTTSGTIVELATYDYTLGANAGSWGGVPHVAVHVELKNRETGVLLPVGTYEFFLSHNQTVYGVTSLGVRAVAAPATETVQTLDIRGTFSCTAQSPPQDHTLSVLQTGEQNADAIAAAMMTAHLLFVATPSQRVRVIFPAGRYKISRRFCPPWGVIADLSQGCVLEVDDTVAWNPRAVAVDAGGNSLDTRCPAALSYAFKSTSTSDSYNAMCWPLEAGTDSVMGGEIVGGELVSCRSIFPLAGNYPQHVIKVQAPDSSRGGASGVNNVHIRDIVLRNNALAARSGVDSLTAIHFAPPAGSANSARVAMISRVRISGVTIFAKSAIGGPPRYRSKYVVIDRSEVIGHGAGPQIGEFGRILQNHTLIRRTKWSFFQRGPVGRPDASSCWRSLVFDCQSIHPATNAGGSEQLMWEHVGCYTPPSVTYSQGGNPLVMRVLFRQDGEYDFEVDKHVMIVEGPGMGQIRRITAFAKVTVDVGMVDLSSNDNGGVYDITVDRAWTGSPDSNSRLIVEGIPYQNAVAVYRQTNGFKGLVIFGAMVDFVAAMNWWIGVDMPINLIGRARASLVQTLPVRTNNDPVQTSNQQFTFTRVSPIYDARILRNEYLNCGCAVWVTAAYEVAGTSYVLVDIADNASYHINSPWVCKADYVGYGNTTGPGLWGLYFKQSRWDTWLAAAYRSDGVGASDQGYPIRRLLDALPITFQEETNGQTPWNHLTLLDPALNGHLMGVNPASQVTLEDFVGPVDENDRPIGVSVVGSSPTDIQIQTDTVVNVDQFNDRLTDAENDITTLRTDLGTTPISPALKTQVGTLATSLSSLGITVTNQGTSISSLQTSHNTLSTTVDGHTTTLSGYGTRITTAENDINALESTVGGHTTTIGSHTTTLSSHATTIGTHTTQITALQSADTALTVQVSDLADDLADVTGLNDRMDAVEATVAASELLVSTLNTNVSGLAGSVSTLGTTTSAHTTTINTHTSQISSLSGSIGAATSAINDLEPRVSAAEETLEATQQSLVSVNDGLDSAVERVSAVEQDVQTIFSDCCAEQAEQLLPPAVVLKNISGQTQFFGFLPGRGQQTLAPDQEVAFGSDFYQILASKGTTAIQAFQSAVIDRQLQIIKTTDLPTGLLPSDLLPS